MISTMKGTSGSTFTVIAETAAGRVGYRALGSDGFRVRVEPTVGSLAFPEGWNKPDSSHNRYSLVVKSTEQLAVAVALAVGILASKSLPANAPQVEKEEDEDEDNY